MRKSLLFLIAILVFSASSFAQTFYSSQLPILLKKLYGVETYERNNTKLCSPVFTKITDSTDQFYNMSNEYGLYLDYFLTVYGLDNFKQIFQYKNDSTRFSTQLYNSLVTAPLFNKCLALTVSVYAKERGFLYKDYTPPSHPFISMNDLMKVASKFFYAVDITGDTAIEYYMCVGNNPYRMEGLRSKDEPGAFIEAFCFSAIMRNSNDERYSYYDYYDRYTNELMGQIRTIEPANRLLWARNKLYAKMEKCKDLQRMLKYEYELHKTVLPFTLSE